MTDDLYDAIGPHQPGDFFVAHTAGWAGTVIRAFTRGRYNHAGIITTPQGDTIEMAPNGWRFWTGAARANRVRATCTIITPRNDDGTPLRDLQRANIVAYARRHHELGTRYNWVGLLALAAAQYGLGWLPGVKNKLADNRDLFCSQLVDDALTANGVHLFDDGRDAGDCSPSDLDDAAGQKNWLRRHIGRVRVSI